MATIINSDKFEDEVLNKDGVVLVDFFAEWCGPCKMVAPILEELSDELEGKVEIFKIDVDSNPDVASEYGVMSIPTLILFKDGEAIDEMVGFQPKDSLKAAIEKHI